MAQVNPRWGAVRIVGELRALGIEVSASTVRHYRWQTPRQPPYLSWRTFLRLHAPEIWAADLFTVPTLIFRTLYVLFLVSHDRRRVVHWNVTAHPTAPWVWRQIIQTTPWNAVPRFLIRDQDRGYGRDFVRKAARIGITTMLTPVRAPQVNAIAERVIGTIRWECLDHLIGINARHRRHLLRESLTYDNDARPHRALALDPPAGPRILAPPSPRARIVAEPVLGGLHQVYRWAA